MKLLVDDEILGGALGLGGRVERGSDGRTVEGVAEGRVAAVGPVEELPLGVKFEVDGLGRPVNKVSISVRLEAVWPSGISILARKIRPSHPLEGPF